MAEPPLLDAEAVGRLLPQRPPMRMVDAVQRLDAGPPPSLRAWKVIRADDPILAGHFPGRPVWPGALVIEGLAQSCLLLGVLLSLSPDGGGLPVAVLEPGALPPLAGAGGGYLLAAADVRFVDPVGPGHRLDYLARLAPLQPSPSLLRFEVDAERGGRPVARGSLILARPTP